MGGRAGKALGFSLLVTGLFFPAALAGFAVSLGVGTATAAALGGYFVLAGSALLVKSYLSSKLGAGGALSGAPKQTLRGAVVDAQWVVGRSRTAGLLTRYYENEDGDGAAAFLVVSEGACDGIEGMWIQGERVTLQGSSQDELRLGSGKWRNRTWLRVRLDADGTQGQRLSSTFGVPSIGDDGSRNFTANNYNPRVHTYQGLSWVLARYVQPDYGNDQEKRFWTQNPVQSTEFLVRGIKITWPGQSTPTWTENAAAIRYWFMRERMGIPAAAFDEASVRAAVRLCGELIRPVLPPEYARFDRSDIRYSINGVIRSSDDPAAVLREMDFAWQGNAVEVNGKWYFRPGSDRPITRTLNVDQSLRPSIASPSPSLTDRVNALTMSLEQSDEHDYVEYELPVFSDAAAEARDGERLLEDLGRISFVKKPVPAGRIMATFLRRARANASYTYSLRPTTSLEWLSVIPGDRIAVNDPDRGLSGARMRVVSNTLNPDLSVDLQLDEAPDGIYDDTLVLPSLQDRDVVFDQVAAATPVPTGVFISEFDELQSDGTSLIALRANWNSARVARTEVRWQLVTDGLFQLGWGMGETCLEWGRSSNPDNNTDLLWAANLPDGPSTDQPAVIQQVGITNTVAGSIYRVIVRHISQEGIASDWTQPLRHVVAGDKTAPPPPIFSYGSYPYTPRGQIFDPPRTLFHYAKISAPDWAGVQLWRSRSHVGTQDASPFNANADLERLIGLTSGDPRGLFDRGRQVWEFVAEDSEDDGQGSLIHSHGRINGHVGYVMTSRDHSNNYSAPVNAGVYRNTPDNYEIWRAQRVVDLPIVGGVPQGRIFRDGDNDVNFDVDDLIGDADLRNTSMFRVTWRGSINGVRVVPQSETTDFPIIRRIGHPPGGMPGFDRIVPYGDLSFNGGRNAVTVDLEVWFGARQFRARMRWYVFVENGQRTGFVFYIDPESGTRDSTSSPYTPGTEAPEITILAIEGLVAEPGGGTPWDLAYPIEPEG